MLLPSAADAYIAPRIDSSLSFCSLSGCLLSYSLTSSSSVHLPLLSPCVAAEGLTFKEVLTGFKYMGNEMEAARRSAGPDGKRRVIFAFEEAIGFACGDTVRDKDGVSAAAVFAQMAYGLRARGVSVSQRLGQLFAKYGLHLSRNHYLFVDEPAKTTAIFARLRNEGHYWKRLGAGAEAGAPLNITAIRDLTSPGWDSEAADGKPSLPTSGGSHMITYKVRQDAAQTADVLTVLSAPFCHLSFIFRLAPLTVWSAVF